MKRQSFYSFLRAHRDRPDRVGDLARFAAKNPSWPKQAHELRHVRAFLECEGARGEQINVLEAAWAEFRGLTQEAQA
jgi:uncharacterized protein YozE (UPF0346 family)